jgi:glycosyltransferase involved in cell wall biosynthesis
MEMRSAFNGQMPWMSFCISTYKRPELLKKQLLSLAGQTRADFEVVISDNDPDASARAIVQDLADTRFRYFHNGENIGMISSFNKSIERAETAYITMVTDDDPIKENFLEDFYSLLKKYPGYSIYCGFVRKNKEPLAIEIFREDKFAMEVLDSSKTPNLLWSSCIISREDAIRVGKIPNYGSPHLADHALIAMVGSVRGGVIINKMFSSLTSHETNYSKQNFESYVKGCQGFYMEMKQFFLKTDNAKPKIMALERHLETWFFSNMFNLKRYYTVRRQNNEMLEKVNYTASQILALPFMKKHTARFVTKNFIFRVKKGLHLLK